MTLLIAIALYVCSASIFGCVHSQQSCPSVLKAIKDILCDCKKTKCDAGWIEYNNHCYYFSVDKRNWSESDQYCKDHGSYLAKVEDQNENQWILSKANQQGDIPGHILFLGGNDLMKEGHWVWSVDSSPLSYQPWDYQNKEPNGGTRENCLNLMSSAYDGRWNDYPCDWSMRYVCEKEKV